MAFKNRLYRSERGAPRFYRSPFQSCRISRSGPLRHLQLVQVSIRRCGLCLFWQTITERNQWAQSCGGCGVRLLWFRSFHSSEGQNDKSRKPVSKIKTVEEAEQCFSHWLFFFFFFNKAWKSSVYFHFILPMNSGRESRFDNKKVQFEPEFLLNQTTKVF